MAAFTQGVHGLRHRPDNNTAALQVLFNDVFGGDAV